jgi:hypothetical protein
VNADQRRADERRQLLTAAAVLVPLCLLIAAVLLDGIFGGPSECEQWRYDVRNVQAELRTAAIKGRPMDPLTERLTATINRRPAGCSDPARP